MDRVLGLAGVVVVNEGGMGGDLIPGGEPTHKGFLKNEEENNSKLKHTDGV